MYTGRLSRALLTPKLASKVVQGRTTKSTMLIGGLIPSLNISPTFIDWVLNPKVNNFFYDGPVTVSTQHDARHVNMRIGVAKCITNPQCQRDALAGVFHETVMCQGRVTPRHRRNPFRKCRKYTRI